MQITNVNIRFTIIPTISKHEKYIIDNRAEISENSDKFLLSLVKRLKIDCYY